MEINIYLASLTMFFLMVIVPPVVLFFFKNKPKTIKIITIILGIVYAVLLIIGTTAKVYMNGANVVISYPNSDKWFSLHFAIFNTGKANILVNLALLFPVGLIVSVFSKNRRFVKTILISLVISILIELFQFILPIHRTTELADVILNTLSGLLSALYCKLLDKLKLFDFKN